jgi:hypothetical protein
LLDHSQDASRKDDSPKTDSAKVESRNDDSRDTEDDPMEAAIDRIMQTYDLLVNCSAAASAEARAKVTEYINTLFEAGERDAHRLTVCGLAYLRKLDGTADPVKEGYTGL